jgi:transcriptional regulator with XRE-family HTH domain
MGLQIHDDWLDDVKRAYIQLNLTQTRVAIATGLTQATVSQFGRGYRIRSDNFRLICQNLRLDWETCQLPKVATTEASDAPNVPNYPDHPLPLNSPHYISRSRLEQDCYAEIARSGALIKIKAPQRFGKSSLLLRVLDHAARQCDQKVIYINLRDADQTFLASPQQFLSWFCNMVAVSLELSEDKILAMTEHHRQLAAAVGNTRACLSCFESHLLPGLTKPLTLCLDQVDRILSAAPIAQDFFGLLRAMNERSIQGGNWQQLRLVLVHRIHSIETFVDLDINQSPFNVGLPIELAEWELAEIQELAQRYQLDLAAEQLAQIRKWLGGHPFLTHLALYRLAKLDIAFGQLFDREVAAQIFQAPLQSIQRKLERDDHLRSAFRQVLATTESVLLSPVLRYELRALGLVQFKGDQVGLAGEFYRQYFQGTETRSATR